MAGEELRGSQSSSDQGKSGPSRIMSRQMAIYYSNCAMVATSPKDVAILFGRYVPANDETGAQSMAELYERQIYMTLEQAEELARTLNQTVLLMRQRQEEQAKQQATQ